MLVLTLNSLYPLIYNGLKLRFVFFLMPIFQSIPGRNGLSKRIALVQKLKNAVFRKFLFSFKKNRQKRANSKHLLTHH